MLTRTIWNTTQGSHVVYNNRKCIVTAVYPYTAYMKDLETGNVECAGIGDLVISGLEPSLPLTKEMLMRKAAKQAQA